MRRARVLPARRQTLRRLRAQILPMSAQKNDPGSGVDAFDLQARLAFGLPWMNRGPVFFGRSPKAILMGKTTSKKPLIALARSKTDRLRPFSDAARRALSRKDRNKCAQRLPLRPKAKPPRRQARPCSSEPLPQTLFTVRAQNGQGEAR